MVGGKQFSFPSVGSDKVVLQSSSQLGLEKHVKLCFCLWELVFIDVAVSYLGRVGQSPPEERWFGYFNGGCDVSGSGR